MPPTLEEIAELARVSRSTVSRVINNDPNVSDRTRQQVQSVIQKLNFQPNRAARSLAGGRTHVLGLVIPMGVARLFTDPYFPILIQGVTSACNAHDHAVMLWLAEPEYEHRMINQVLHNGLIDGIIVSSMVLSDPLLKALQESSLPYILIGRHPTEDGASYVDVDNYEGASEAVTYLLRQGRRRIATITGPSDMIAGIDRREGYQEGLRERGFNQDPNLVVEGDFTEEGGYLAARRLLAQNAAAPFDAIFAASDAMALGALRALREAGLTIPDDVALVGFDDIPFAARSEPPLTTIRQPILRTGAVAAEALIDRIENPSSTPRRILLPTELVIRTSA
jgi:LacI family transcriptional regulator